MRRRGCTGANVVQVQKDDAGQDLVQETGNRVLELDVLGRDHLQRCAGRLQTVTGG